MRKFWRRILAVLSNCKGELIVPDDVLDTLARLYLPAIQKFYEDENNVKLFEQWQIEQKLLKEKS